MVCANNWINIDYSRLPITCTMDLSNIRPMTKQQAIDHTVDEIIKDGRDLYVAMSGGIDSEFAATCLLNHGIKFTPILVDYGFNLLELWYAYYWCYRNKISPMVINIPKEQVIKIFPKVMENNCGTAFLSGVDYAIMAKIPKENSKIVTGCGDPFPIISGVVDNLSTTTKNKIDIESYDFNFYRRGYDSAPFILYTPELFYNSIKELDYSKPVQIAKCEYYGVIPRPRFSPFIEIMANPSMKTLVDNTIKKSQMYNFMIGDKDEFLKNCVEKKVLTIVGTRYKNDI
jgi:hypothetical protein